MNLIEHTAVSRQPILFIVFLQLFISHVRRNVTHFSLYTGVFENIPAYLFLLKSSNLILSHYSSTKMNMINFYNTI